MEATNRELHAFFQNISTLRSSHKLTQKEMAKICGDSLSTLRKLEHNILPSRMSVRIIFNISNYFHLRPEQLFINLPGIMPGLQSRRSK